MSSFTVPFTLKQHTPIIHFQADQSGATLRATELKPKFDKFLKKYAFNGNIPNEYKISKDRDALDYKVKIFSLGKLKKFKYKTYISKRERDDKSLKLGSYFGNLEAVTSDKVKVEFFSFNAKMLELIEKYFIDFILITNFGTRQNKGFGSFSVIKCNGEQINYDVEKILKKYYSPIYKTSNSDPLSKILFDYQIIKSGRNKPYKKSLLFEYMCSKFNIGWEKKFLKKKFPCIIHGEHKPIKCEQSDDREFRYIRALLGLAEINEYRPKNGKKQIRIESVQRDPEDNKKPKYQRFKSPITFKVINNDIYLLCNDSYKIILNKKFKFTLKGESVTLYTPEEFDIFDFFSTKVAKELKYKEIK